MSTIDLPRWLSPPEVADVLHVSPDRVIGWIRSGRLRAVNVGDGAKRPRFRVSPDALEVFLAGRSVVPPPEPQVRRRRTSGKRWY